MPTCSQEGCPDPVVGRYTWPGRDESYTCAAHRAKLKQVADALGFHLQVHDVAPPPEEVDGELVEAYEGINDAPEPERPTPIAIVDPCGNAACGHALTDHFEGCCQVAECACPRYVPGFGV